MLADGADPAGTAGRVARSLAANEVLRERLVRGLDLALLPADAHTPGEALFTR